MTILTYALAGGFVALIGGVSVSMQRRKLRRSLERGRLRADHIAALLVIVERKASGKNTSLSQAAQRLARPEAEVLATLKDLTASGCAQHEMWWYKPTKPGVELLQSVGPTELAAQAAEVLEDRDRMLRLCAMAHASMASSADGGDSG
jgi:hypothetical protein